MDSIGKAATGALSRPQSTQLSITTSGQRTETAKIARILLGWDDRRNIQDPEVYAASIVAVLSDFPLEVQRIVADPRSAVLSRFKGVWPFTERVRQACEELHGPQCRLSAWEERSKAQLEDRAAREREMAEPRIDLKAKYGPSYGLTVTKLPDDEEDRTKRLASMARYSAQCIERDYLARGEEPKPYSRSLAENVREASRRSHEIGPTREE